MAGFGTGRQYAHAQMCIKKGRSLPAFFYVFCAYCAAFTKNGELALPTLPFPSVV